MINISEQINYLRGYITSDENLYDALHEAADTIEALSAKLADMEKSDKNYCEEKKLIEAMAEEIENCYGGETELSEKAREYLERSAEDFGGGWIYCGDGNNLPEKDTECLIRYYNSKEERRITDIAWIDEYGDWQFIREVGGYFPLGFKKEITYWMSMPED